MNSNSTQTYEQGDIIAYDFDDRQSEVNFIISKIQQLMGAEYTKDGKTYGLNYDDMVILVSSVKKISELIQKLQNNEIDFIVEGTSGSCEHYVPSHADLLPTGICVKISVTFGKTEQRILFVPCLTIKLNHFNIKKVLPFVTYE